MTYEFFVVSDVYICSKDSQIFVFRLRGDVYSIGLVLRESSNDLRDLEESTQNWV